MGFDYNVLNQATNLFSTLNQGKHEILTVSSLQQAKDFVMNRGESYLLLDPNADLLYVREKDFVGKDFLKIFALTDVTSQYIDNQAPVSISKSDYEKLLNRITQLEKGGSNGIKESDQPELNFDADK